MSDRSQRRDHFLKLLRERPAIMGILNATPDSFSDGGRFFDADRAVEHAGAMVAEGADIVDVGGESTRPGSSPLSAAQEWARLESVLTRLGASLSVPISIDTMKAEVARRAAALGACVINDVWGLQRDPDMAAAVAETGCAVVVMHNRAEIDASLDILDDMRRFFDDSLARAQRAGVPREHVLLDPGVGFGKSQAQNLDAIWRLDRLADYGLPILVGLSRKSFIGRILGVEVDKRLTGTLTADVVALLRGASVLRVHDVGEHRQVVAMVRALKGL